VPQVACFDTAFHRGHDFVNEAYALPRALYDRGLRRFGFHGLSYEFIARRLCELDPQCAKGRVIVAHLGNGASLCAMKNGRSVASTMGFSALEGLPMGTRCGQIDPGLLLYLLEHDKMSTAELSRLLYRESGLFGLSGVSQDMRALEASDARFAQDAIDYFVHRIQMEIGALAATIEGIDALIFTGGIGEHSARVRAGVIGKLGWLGLAFDRDANEAHAQLISAPSSSASIYVLTTDEEAMIAHHAIEAVGLIPAAAA
jgi:acetate kinase